jgi:tetratricopeptide (TPR) repeat protein
MNHVEGSPPSVIRIGTRLDEYEVVSLLEEGGMGRVFVAENLLTGQRAAVKALRSREPGMITHFRREIHVLRTLSHPAIVPFRAHGVVDGEPWYAMDLLEGATLKDALRETTSAALATREQEPSVPDSGLRLRLSTEQLLAICVKLFEALECVHDHGIVHGDIKPENVFLRDGEEPVLVDFGVAMAFDRPRERLELVPQSIGSVAYIAPERLRGSLPDARADLYAMGCVLYQCLTGHHPFLRSTLEGTKLAHLRANVLPPSRLSPTISRALDALVLRLLAKSPADRPGYARDALEVLRAPGRAPVDALRAERARHGYLYRAPLVGRGEELELLHGCLVAAQKGSGGRVLIRGETGMGKTRLALELLQRAAHDGGEVFHLECVGTREAQTQAWLEPLQALVRALEEQRSDAPSLVHVRASRAALELLNQDPLLAPERRTAAREDLVQGLIAALGALDAPYVVVVVDDVHHADDLTREFVRRLAATECWGSRLLLLCTAGPEPALDPAFRERFHCLTLAPLGEAEVDAAIRAMLAVDFPSPSFVSNAFEVSQGNPYILGVYLRALIDEGMLRRDRHRGWHIEWQGGNASLAPQTGKPAVAVSSVTALFEWRLHKLAPSELTLASRAALLGTSFDAATLAAIVELPLSVVEETLAALCRHEILEPLGAERYRFGHATLTHLLAAGVDANESKLIHRRAAAVLRARPAGTPPLPSALARHLSVSGSHRKAARSFAAAARWYLAAHRREDALECFDAAIRELMLCRAAARLYPDELFELYEAMGDVAVSLRKYQAGAGAYRQALAFGGTDPIRTARQYRKLAGAQQRDRDKAQVSLRRAIMVLDAASVRAGEYHVEWIQVHLDTMWLHYWKHESDAMLEIARSIASEVEAFGSAPQRASLEFNLAVGLMQHHRYVTGAVELAHAERALAIYESLEDRTNVAMCRFVRSMILLFAGDLDAAEAGFDQVLDVSEKATSVTIRVRALTFLCIVARRRKAREKVRRLATAAQSLAKEHDMLEYQGTAMANLAWVALEDGEFGECERLVKAAIAAWDASPLNVFRWTGLLPLMATVVARESRPADATELAGIAVELMHPLQQRLPDPLVAELTRLHAAAPSGSEPARLIARRALALAADIGLI